MIIIDFDSLKLENQICFPLYALSREVIKMYKPFLDPFDLTYTQYIAMLVVWESEKISFKDMGERLHLDSGTLTPVLKKLQSKGLIIKYRNKDDDRTVTIELTEKGFQLKKDILHVPESLYCVFKGSEEKLMQLKDLLFEFLAGSDIYNC